MNFGKRWKCDCEKGKNEDIILKIETATIVIFTKR